NAVNELLQRGPVRAIDDARHYIAFALYSADHDGLAALVAFLLVQMAVVVIATDKRFVHFDNAHELAKFLFGEACTDAVAHVPSGAIAPKTHCAVNLKGADALLGRQHHVDDLEPDAQ